MAKAERKKRSTRKRLQSWGIQLLIVILLLLAFEAVMTRESLGMLAPEIDSVTIAEQHFSLKKFDGKPAVVHFWATWCPVCEVEQGMINSLSKDIPMITVAMQSGTPDKVRDYLKQQGVSYAVVNDERSWLAEQYKVKAVPASFILDGEGRVRFATRGYTTGWGIRVRLWLAGLF